MLLWLDFPYRGNRTTEATAPNARKVFNARVNLQPLWHNSTKLSADSPDESNEVLETRKKNGPVLNYDEDKLANFDKNTQPPLEPRNRTTFQGYSRD